MAETHVNDDSRAPSTTTLEEKQADQEIGDVYGGDIEAARERNIQEKVDAEPEPKDPFLVEWNGTDDPDNPLNFRSRKKVLVMMMIAGIAFLTYPRNI
jgi:hypothetical protein